MLYLTTIVDDVYFKVQSWIIFEAPKVRGSHNRHSDASSSGDQIFHTYQRKN